MKNELPADPVLRDKVILAIYGSPDLRQIDGLGGADLLTSKLAIISPPTVPEADVNYTFGQVSTAEAFVDYGGNCGNISSAVGPFAIDKGLVPPLEPKSVISR
ncbi:MAG TPA: PrpF domain-containing protein [Negativicutes bacterium]|nr:PrpF domain-containing protein [Negativicutes bacterium]